MVLRQARGEGSPVDLGNPSAQISVGSVVGRNAYVAGTFDTKGRELTFIKTCLEKLRNVNDMMGADEFVAVFSYGSMPVEKAEKSMRIFAEKVLPATQSFALAEAPLLVS